MFFPRERESRYAHKYPGLKLSTKAYGFKVQNPIKIFSDKNWLKTEACKLLPVLFLFTSLSLCQYHFRASLYHTTKFVFDLRMHQNASDRWALS